MHNLESRQRDVAVAKGREANDVCRSQPPDLHDALTVAEGNLELDVSAVAEPLASLVVLRPFLGVVAVRVAGEDKTGFVEAHGRPGGDAVDLDRRRPLPRLVATERAGEIGFGGDVGIDTCAALAIAVLDVSAITVPPTR